MKIGTLFTVNAILALAFGLGFLIVPAHTLAPYGVEMNVQGLFIGRLFGASLIGYGIVSWLLRGAGETEAVRAVAISFTVADALGAVIAIWMVLTHNVNALGWSTDAIEAQAFGFLAARGLKGLPLSYPATTGVPMPMTGGVIARP